MLYATPDHQAMIAGVMWDATGKNLTRDQVSKIDGVVPTVVVKDGDKELAALAGESGLGVVRQATFGIYGRDGAPELWMIIDPACSFSIRAFDDLKPFVEAGRLQLRIVPISILDHEDNGMSTKAALALLTNPLDRMANVWMQRNFGSQPTPAALANLQTNGQIAEAIKLTGTPTFLYRKPNGSEGRLDGMPTDIKALLAEVSGRS
jgi:thiol:disulfide interchange protein DsbG